jgi:chromosome segregation ATPase
VEDEDYHGKALLVRVCLKVANRLFETFVQKINTTKEALLQDYASVEAVNRELVTQKEELEQQLEQHLTAGRRSRASATIDAAVANARAEGAARLREVQRQHEADIATRMADAAATRLELQRELDEAKDAYTSRIDEAVGNTTYWRGQRDDLELKVAGLELEVVHVKNHLEEEKTKRKTEEAKVADMEKQLKALKEERDNYHLLVQRMQLEEDAREKKFLANRAIQPTTSSPSESEKF